MVPSMPPEASVVVLRSLSIPSIMSHCQVLLCVSGFSVPGGMSHALSMRKFGAAFSRPGAGARNLFAQPHPRHS